MLTFTSYASSSAGNLYTLTDADTSLIIEAGVQYREMQRLLPSSPAAYDACIISHQHGDHCNEQSVTKLRKRGVPVVFGEDIEHSTEFGTITAKSVHVEHDVPNYGFMFRSSGDGQTCVFLIDTFYCPFVTDFSPSIVAIECNYARDLMQLSDSLSDRLFCTHMSLEQCIKTLKTFDLSQTREIHLLHLSDERSDEDRFVREVQDTTRVPTWAAPKGLYSANKTTAK